MFFTYILQSEIDKEYYVGYTSDLSIRLKWHNEGRNKSTRHRRLMKIVYSEAFENKKDAIARETQIKSYKGGNAFKTLINRGEVA